MQVRLLHSIRKQTASYIPIGRHRQPACGYRRKVGPGAAHRVWTHIRGLFGGASDETMLSECERGEDASMARYRKALKANLPHDIHALVLRQFEEVRRDHDMIRSLRDQARARSKITSDEG
jgi:hypothetical protein